MGQEDVELFQICEIKDNLGGGIPKKIDIYSDCCNQPDIVEYRGMIFCKNCSIVFGPVNSVRF